MHLYVQKRLGLVAFLVNLALSSISNILQQVYFLQTKIFREGTKSFGGSTAIISKQKMNPERLDINNDNYYLTLHSY